MIKSCLYCTTDALALPSFAWRPGNGLLRMGWNGWFTYAFISSSEGKTKTFNKTFTTVQISVSLHPHFPPSVKLYEDVLHFLLPASSLPIPPLMQTIKAGLLGAPESGGYFQSSDVSLWKKHFRLRWTSWYFLWIKILILFLGLLHFPFLKYRKRRQISLLSTLLWLVGYTHSTVPHRKHSTDHIRDHRSFLFLLSFLGCG